MQEKISNYIEDAMEEGYIPGYMEVVDIDGVEVDIAEHMTYNQYMNAVGV